MAIGNPFGLGGTVTVGIISARNRDISAGSFDDFIQTDAAINKGNSGGPLFNLRGEVIGINTAIISPGNEGGSVGVGFSVPANFAKVVVSQLKEFKSVRRGTLGVTARSIDQEQPPKAFGLKSPQGAILTSVAKGAPPRSRTSSPATSSPRSTTSRSRKAAALFRIMGVTQVGTQISVRYRRQQRKRHAQP